MNNATHHPFYHHSLIIQLYDIKLLEIFYYILLVSLSFNVTLRNVESIMIKMMINKFFPKQYLTIKTNRLFSQYISSDRI